MRRSDDRRVLSALPMAMTDQARSNEGGVAAGPSREDAWLWGWDPTEGIVSVWAEPDGRAWVWRRVRAASASGSPDGLVLVREERRFRPWLLLAHLDDLRHLGHALIPASARTAGERGRVTFEELSGDGHLRWLVHADDGRALASAVVRGAGRRLGRRIEHVKQLPREDLLVLPPDEQYLVATGRTYFRGLTFDDVRRVQFDLETTGLDPAVDRIFLIAVRRWDGEVATLEDRHHDDAGEAALLRRFCEVVSRLDPDVLENHNLHGFDMPFVVHRAALLGVPLPLTRLPAMAPRKRPAGRRGGASFGGARGEDDEARRVRYTLAGRELIDTMDAVRRHDFAARDLPGHGLKVVAKHLGIAAPDREYVPGNEVFEVFRADPARVRRYAGDDVEEAAGVSRTLGGAAFALAQMAPRRYERLADAGPATGVLDPLMVRAYLREGCALPSYTVSDGTAHTGAGLHLFATGVAHRVVKADVASLYPSLMRQYRIGPRSDRLGVLVTLVERLVEQRLAAKARGRAAAKGSAERHAQEAVSAAMKLVVNSAYGYLGAVGLTRFADVHAANEVTARGRALLDLLCGELRARGVTLLEADTDGVYFAVPPSWSEEDERRTVAEVGALLPPLVRLEFDGRYRAMLSHEPKNYALQGYDDPKITLRGVAFRSSRAEPYGVAFLERAIAHLFASDLPGLRKLFVRTVQELRRREVPTRDVASRVRLTKTPEEYAASREVRRELGYEALLGSGRTRWRTGERIHVYRQGQGRAGLLTSDDQAPDPRDYDVDYYVRLLRDSFAERLIGSLAPEVFDAVFADPDQLRLFDGSLADARPILTVLADPVSVEDAGGSRRA